VKSIESAEVVVETAEWCGFEKTVIWHRRLAMALRDLGFLDECIEYFQKAIQLGSTADAWLTRAEMATAYIREKEYRKAAEAQEICMQLLDKSEEPFPNDSHKSNGQVHRVLESLGLCYNQLGEFEKGLSLHRKAFGYNNRCNTCVRAILAYLDMEGRYTESMDLLQEMDEKIPGADFTRLSECLMTNSELSDAFTH
jgi:tetratricopeptide (TPR) repeat protein